MVNITGMIISMIAMGLAVPTQRPAAITNTRALAQAHGGSHLKVPVGAQGPGGRNCIFVG